MNISTNVIQQNFWSMKVDEVIRILGSNTLGLSDKEANERILQFGKNLFRDIKPLSKTTIFLRQFKSPLISILVFAGILTLVIGDYKDAAIIFAAIIVNTLLGYYQEQKAEYAVHRLSIYVKERVRVVRGGEEKEITAEELVPGDIVRLYQGNRVPGDARLIYENDLFIDESILTGESMPVEKSLNAVSPQAGIGDQHGMVFAGTLITQGIATAVICRTGLETEIGKIAKLVSESASETTPLTKAIRNLSYTLAIVLGLLIALVFIFGIIRGIDPMLMLVTAIAMAVGAVPEGLPIALTVILAIGVERLSRRDGVVRKLLAAETLGSTSVILTDKTGTLTEAKMSLTDIMITDKKFDEQKLLRYAIINTNILIENKEDNPVKWVIRGRPLEVALAEAARDRGVFLPDVKKEFNIIAVLPFNSLSKFSASLVTIGAKRYTVLLGAPEILLNRSLNIGNKKISDGIKNEILSSINDFASAGKRILGIAIREERSLKKLNFKDVDALKNLKFLGLIAFGDPVRETVPEALRRVAEYGVKTVMVTGDYRGTAIAIAREVGLEAEDRNVMDGHDLDQLPIDELKKRIKYITIFSRVSPEGKTKIVQAYQELGEVVAMTGDGVNDAPSLKKADIGVAMGSGTDVSKDVADLIILDDNFETIVAAIEEGRKILGNMRKVIVYLFSSMFVELFLIGGSVLIGLASLPLTAAQILWVNFFSDSFPAIALGFENDPKDIGRRPKKIAHNILDPEIKFLTLVIGTISSLMLFAIYYLLITAGYDEILVRTFIFASFGLYSIFLILSVRSLSRNIFSYGIFGNKYITLSIMGSMVLMLSAIYWSPLQLLLGTISLPFIWMLGVVGIIIVNIAAIEFGKYIYRNREF